MSDIFGSFKSIAKIQARAVVGVVVAIIAGVGLGLFAGWEIGLITGLVIAGISVIYAVVAGARAARQAFDDVSGAAGAIIKDVTSAIEQDDAETARPPRQDFARNLTPPDLPTIPRYGALPPEIAQQYGVVQPPNAREFFAQQRQEAANPPAGGSEQK